jgi:hypothetical protein
MNFAAGGTTLMPDHGLSRLLFRFAQIMNYHIRAHPQWR